MDEAFRARVFRWSHRHPTGPACYRRSRFRGLAPPDPAYELHSHAVDASTTTRRVLNRPSRRCRVSVLSRSPP